MFDLPGSLQVLSSVVGGVGLGVLVWLLVRGVVVTSASCEERVQALKTSHATEVALIHAGHADSLTALNLAHDNQRRQLELQLAASAADHEAWHGAYTEEAGARRAAEAVSRQLMESTNVTAALLSALKDSLARTLPTTGRDSP